MRPSRVASPRATGVGQLVSCSRIDAFHAGDGDRVQSCGGGEGDGSRASHGLVLDAECTGMEPATACTRPREAAAIIATFGTEYTPGCEPEGYGGLQDLTNCRPPPLRGSPANQRNPHGAGRSSV